jgi:hypothetical protein
VKLGRGLVLASALATALASGGCSDSVTETLLTVSASGLTVGTDLNQLHLSAVDTTVNFTGFDQTLDLCDAPASGCHTLPLSVVLHPGSRLHDSVRVLVEGVRDSTVVIADAAIVTFDAGVRNRLDIVLYGACVGHLECAVSDEVCGPDGHCTTVGPTGPDLAGSDVGLGDDMPFTVCGAEGQPCCSTPQCNSPNLACVGTKCLPCGGASQWCCPSLTPCGAGLGCDYLYHCSSGCGIGGGYCCANEMCNNACSFGQCLPGGCGTVGVGCCPGGLCADGLSCVNSQCVADSCNSTGATCCTTTASPHCTAGLSCYNGSCYACGRYGQPACSVGNPCWPGLQPDPWAGICECGAPGEYCCGGTNGVCFGGSTCATGTCQ